MWVLYFTRKSWTHKSYLKYVDQQVARILNDVFIFYFERNEILSERIMGCHYLKSPELFVITGGITPVKVTPMTDFHYRRVSRDQRRTLKYTLSIGFSDRGNERKIEQTPQYTGGACETCHVTRIHHDARSAKSPLGFTCVERDDG